MLLTILTLIYFFNAAIALITILMKPRDVSAIWAWLLVLIALPVFGFILYLFFGRGLGDKKKYRLQQSDLRELENFSRLQEDDTLSLFDPTMENQELQPFVDFFSLLNRMPLTRKNEVEIFSDGEEKLTALLQDLKQAEKSIHIEYYAFVTDKTGQRILKVLEEKAAEGVEVRLLYDAFGSRGTTPKDFLQLEKNGGFAQTFITSQKALLKFRLNYHDHRKIVVVDGKISYIGGFNISNQYVEPTKRFGYWRDTHLRIHGAAASLLQMRFLMDWNVSSPETNQVNYHLDYFFTEDHLATGTTAIQVVASGPNSEKEQIKLAFIKLITSAKKRIWIQTPYLVPDDSVIAALKIAAGSGIEVKIMIPDRPDHPFIYRATQYYARQLLKENVEIQVYRGGFLHAKTLIMDDEICMVGSANQDIRSYKLNFEASAVLYDKKVIQQLEQTFIKDLEVCEEMTQETVANMSAWLIFKQQISRLFSPIL
ncbi:cardiolipin synthase [Enterococcus sp. JM4C]|uniref:cardiolipin synthase n=1 Tax=Candidatus Enterococcus huntleyi TaxID=1857217 RepID=UPI00137AC9F0|nr:cardiolipin synthase [Enterococcus sp. JM4C]KAF1298126.1 cardiolipin synthase [Enterococcus sp. JM4C]